MARQRQSKPSSWRDVWKALGDFSFNVAVILTAGVVATIFLEPKGLAPSVSAYGIVAAFILAGIIFIKRGSRDDD
ncbi:hypothetical protein AGMMS49521_2670 [Campylobacterota bacterium]|nr:hypothetical protein AGMMS49521_2670 [Campylobacterota bacterium]